MMQHMCEGKGCRRRTELHYVRRCDAYLCEDCEQVAVEEPESEAREEEDD